MVNLIKIETVEKIGREIHEAEERGGELCRGGCDKIVSPNHGYVTLYGFVCSKCMPKDDDGIRRLYGKLREARHGKTAMV